MHQSEKKRHAALAAIDYIQDGCQLGVGTGSTVNYFIDALPEVRSKISAVVASSEATRARLEKLGFEVSELAQTGDLDLYVDGADESNRHLHLVKGGGGALTREKIVAAASDKFVCIADESKLVDYLGKFPLPIEVIPMARSYVAREIVKLGGEPVLRQDFVTDNGNIILDVHNWEIMEPVKLEQELNNITGEVTHGLFAMRPADVLLLGTQEGVKTLTA